MISHINKLLKNNYKMADFNVTRFVIDGKTFAIPSAAEGQKGLMSAEDFVKLQGIAEGAQVNVIDGVKANGAAVEIASKILEFAAGSANGSISVNGVDVAVKGLAALAYKAKVSKEDLEEAFATVIDGYGTSIETLKGTGEGSIKKAIDDAFNEFATNVTDDDVVNSYKELIDWAAEHGGDAAEMAAAISKLEGLMAGIGGEGEPATVSAAIEKKVDKVEGYGLSKNDFTDELKAKLDKVDENAVANTYDYDAETETLTLTGFTAAV